MTDVRTVVDGHAADVNADLAGSERNELLDAAAQGVVEANHRRTGC
jgi:hypothetical protein